MSRECILGIRAAMTSGNNSATKVAATRGVASIARVRRSMVIWNTKVGWGVLAGGAAIKYVSWALGVKCLAGIPGILRGWERG
jgi:hypothetical protein